LLFSRHFVNERGIILATVVMMSSCGPVNALANLAGGLSETIACGNRILTILDEPPLIRRVTKGADVRFGGMTVNHVSFGYTKDENVLNNCQMLIPAHKMVGIMGDSGSGKSTLMKLMMRFYDVNSGSIFMSDHDIRDINTHSLRMNEAYMTQDTHIFNDTIAANIAVGKKDALMGDIINAALAASLHDFVESLPDGYNTVVGEDGYKLSSGERQRIGLARAFLSDAPLMLLDEPTSALDALNEGMILRSLEKSRWQKTIVLISHRPSALSRADIVYEIKKI
ncbi:MAG: ABC transporter ATP-binding protein, partial [bacterium]